jgi:3-deoxy-D-manno-octulosonic-acid transferase
LIRIPLSIIPILGKNLNPFLKKRLAFERKNFSDPMARSFKDEKQKAQFCFEISSEGELEQVRPLLMETLEKKLAIEILYSSPSVEDKIEKLGALYPNQVRALRLPLLTFWPISFLYFQNFWFWVTAPVVVFCRYDFFPELLFLKVFGKKLVLLSAATKKWGFYKQQSVSLFDLIVAATPKEEKRFKELVRSEVLHCDLRIPRIAERHQAMNEVLLEKNGEELAQYVRFLEKISPSNKMIFGSFWPSDLDILTVQELADDIKNGSMHLCIVPHKIHGEEFEILHTRLIDLFGQENVRPFTHLDLATNPPAVVLMNKSGILCELYGIFTLSYVGGGYERSIHSVLEPFFSGPKVICGPKISRSTEYDLVAEEAPKEIHVLKNPLSFYNECKDMMKTPGDLLVRTNLINESLRSKKIIVDKINKLSGINQ